MINITIQIAKKSEALKLVSALLEKKLIAEATISEKIYINQPNPSTAEVYTNLITAQTKALLFNTIVSYIVSNFSEDVKIFSTPISQIDDHYSNLIRNNTQKI